MGLLESLPGYAPFLMSFLTTGIIFLILVWFRKNHPTVKIPTHFSHPVGSPCAYARLCEGGPGPAGRGCEMKSPGPPVQSRYSFCPGLFSMIVTFISPLTSPPAKIRTAGTQSTPQSPQTQARQPPSQSRPRSRTARHPHGISVRTGWKLRK